MDGFFRILKKASFQLIYTRLYSVFNQSVLISLKKFSLSACLFRILGSLKRRKKNRFWATKLREDEVGCFASGGEANELTWLFLWKKVTHITRETRGKPFINVLTRVASISWPDPLHVFKVNSAHKLKSYVDQHLCKNLW